MNAIRLFAMILCALLVVHPAFADTVVLKSGETFEGALANRDQISPTFGPDRVLALLHEDDKGKDVMLRFFVKEVDYVVIEDPSGRNVITFSQQPTVPAQISMGRMSRSNSSGTTEILLGLVALGVGFGIKFGDEKATITSDSIDYDEKSYNVANYALIMGGGVLVLVGLISMGSSHSGFGYSTTPITKPTQQTHIPGIRFSLGFSL